MKRVLITGASGFVGKALTSALVTNGYLVRGTYRNAKIESMPGSEWVHTEDLASAPFGELLRDCDYVVHLAALAHQVGREVPAADFDRVNHQATAEIARAVAASTSVRRLIFVSSIGAVCSFSDSPVTSETECRPDSDYGQSKRNAELAVRKILAATPQDYCIIRPSLVYGPGNPGNMLRLMRLTRSPLPLPLGAIRNRRSFLFVGNLADLIEKALTSPGASRQTFNAADNDILSTPDLIRELAGLSGSRARLWPAPIWSLRLLGRAGDLLSKLSKRSLGIDTYSVDRLLGSLEIDNSHVRRTLRWEPPFTTRQGLSLTLKRGVSLPITSTESVASRTPVST